MRRLAIVASVLAITAGGLLAATPPAQTAVIGGLRVSAPTLAHDGDTWYSYGSAASTTASNFVACNPSDPVWNKGFAYVPYRTGAAVDQLGACWDGDAYPGGPPAWADPSPTSMSSPSMAHVNGGWWLFFTAKLAGSSQRCIGGAASPTPNGPNYFSAQTPWVCPATGVNATDPEVVHDSQNGNWYLLWKEDLDTGGCASVIKTQQIDTTNVTLTGTARQLITAKATNLGFDEVSATGCTGNVKHMIGDPSFIRADDGTGWLFFGANNVDSNNYAEGWATCGTGVITSATCKVPNTTANKYKPQWGAANRTAPVTGVDAAPFQSSPSMSGFGALSVAPVDQTSLTTQPVYTVGQIAWGDPTLHTEVGFHVDTSAATPALDEFEPTINLFGTPGTFAPLASGTTTSGTQNAVQGVNGFAYPGGQIAFIGTVAGDGSIVTGNLDQSGTGFGGFSSSTNLSTFSPSSNTFQNATVADTNGATSVPSIPNAMTQTLWNTLFPNVPYESTVPGGAPTYDVQTLPSGDVAFTISSSFAGTDPNVVWPAFGILSKVNGQWQVASGTGWTNQWTGGQIAATNTTPYTGFTPPPGHGLPSPTIGNMVCPPDVNSYAQSNCRYTEEMALLPASGDIVVTQYTSGVPALTEPNPNDPAHPTVLWPAKAGIFVLHLTGPTSAGKYTLTLKTMFTTPASVADPSVPGHPIGLAIRGVHSDPTSTLGDERFVVTYDQYCDAYIPTSGFNKCADSAREPGVFEEYSYNSAQKKITQTSPPTLTGFFQPQDATYNDLVWGTGEARYDRNGNLWSNTNGVRTRQDGGFGNFAGGPIAVWPKVSGQRRIGNGACALQTGASEDSYTSTIGGYAVWGKTCQPNYKLSFGIDHWYGIEPDPSSDTVGVTEWDGQVTAIRTTGSGTSMSFTVGDSVDPDISTIPLGADCKRGNGSPVGFDSGGRLWGLVSQSKSQVDCKNAKAGPARNQVSNQYLYSVDVDRLFHPSSVVLSGTTGGAATIQAERTRTVATTTASGADADSVSTATAWSFPCYEAFGICPDSQPGNGFYLTSPNQSGVQSGTFKYRVDAPSAGYYKLSYRVRSPGGVHSAAITAQGNIGPAATLPVDTGGSWQTVTGDDQIIAIAGGTSDVTLTPATGGGGWELNSFTLTRLG